MIEQVLSYRETLKAQMVRVFKGLYKQDKYVSTLEARKRIQDILGLDSKYFYGRMLTEAVSDHYKKLKTNGCMKYKRVRSYRG